MKTYGLTGFPLGHSFSAAYFAEKFDKAGIQAEYLNFEIADIQRISDILKQYPRLEGFNVTLPHKQNIIPLLDRLSEEARLVGAVNCVKVKRNGENITLTGYNTDVCGFQEALTAFIPATVRKALILGNGGAAKAVRYTLHGLGIETLTVSRTPHHPEEIGYPEVLPLLNEFPLIVNTTPLGTWPHTAACPDIPYDRLTSGHYLFDLVYNPEITTFMQRGAAAGAQVSNGMQMLVGQAEAAWRIWNEEK